MKKISLVLILLMAISVSAFSGNTSLGLAQNYVDTSFIVDTELGRFGVEGSIGLPLVWGTIDAIDSIINGSSFDITEILLPGLMLNPYFKLVEGDNYQFRLGLQNDTLVFANKDEGVQAMGLVGISLGLNYKFNQKFGMNITLGCPLALPLSAISKDAASWTVYYFSSREYTDDDILKMIVGGYGCAINQFARLSLKWSLN